MDVRLDISQRRTIDMPPPRTTRAITQPGYHRPNITELRQDLLASSARAYNLIEEAIEQCRDRRALDILRRLLTPVVELKVVAGQVADNLLLMQRTGPAPSTTPLLPELQQQPGRMSSPQLQPMPSAAPWVSATPSLPLRPHKGWRE